MTSRLRIALVQFAPLIGKVKENIDKANFICSRIEPHSVDLVCLPEMVFTGYVFADASAISPYLEDVNNNPTSQFCRDLARRLFCHVAAGYPERSRPGGTPGKVGYNSAVLYGPNGELVGHYRKTNLFETDVTWAKAGDGFKSFSLPPPLRTLSLAICMDLNPQPPAHWQLKEGPYELASYCLEEVAGKPRTNVLLLLNAWLDSKVDPEDEHDYDTLEYWIARLNPLWSDLTQEQKEDETVPSEESKDTIVVICNRAGEENGVLFAGTSAVLRLRIGSNAPEILGLMKRREEGVLQLCI
ncbi:hydrolase [Rickenella mellea]|uniref:Hydrolase n=1 Tax=Rickenella mellea TaxID=50990 RepID=A0A4Y7Q4A2_9AGAM|nr:hydrolase [Rickenella mellea]